MRGQRAHRSDAEAEERRRERTRGRTAPRPVGSSSEALTTKPTAVRASADSVTSSRLRRSTASAIDPPTSVSVSSGTSSTRLTSADGERRPGQLVHLERHGDAATWLPTNEIICADPQPAERPRLAQRARVDRDARQQLPHPRPVGARRRLGMRSTPALEQLLGLAGRACSTRAGGGLAGRDRPGRRGPPRRRARAVPRARARRRGRPCSPPRPDPCRAGSSARCGRRRADPRLPRPRRGCACRSPRSSPVIGWSA